LLPGTEKRPPDLPESPGSTKDDKSNGAVANGLGSMAANAALTQARGTAFDSQTHKNVDNGLDNNPAFTRVIGTANNNKLPVYTPAGANKSYLMPIDLSQVSLVPTAQRSGSTTNTPNSKQPNPLYTNTKVSDFASQAIEGKVAGIDSKKLLAVFNSAYFNEYGARTSISHASLVNGEVTSTGKVEPGDKMLVTWNNSNGSASIRPWAANTTGGYYTGVNGSGPKLASPNQVKTEFGELVGKKSVSGFVGFDAKKDFSKEAKPGTYVGINSTGRMAVFVVGDNLTSAQAVDHLTRAGYGEQVVKLDAGPSSQLSLTTTRSNARGENVTTDRQPESVVSSILDRRTPMPISIVEKP
jgi:hypothetical protein